MNPALVEATRGGIVESVHRGALAIVDARGASVHALGDTARPVFARSAVKVLQALPLVTSGAADALALSDEELALACASHNGQAQHVATAAGMLAKAGLDEAALECGAHWPQHEVAQRELAASGRPLSALHNNCSGKHAGFLCVGCLMARAQGRDAREFVRGYVRRRTPGDARGHGRAAGRHRRRPVARARGHRRLLDPDLRHPADATRAGVRPRGHRRRPERRAGARRRAPARRSGQGAVSRGRQRPLRHQGDAAPGRTGVLQGRRRRRVLRRAARARAWAWPSRSTTATTPAPPRW